MNAELYRTTLMPGACLSVFHRPGDTDVVVTLSTQGAATSHINLYLGTDDLERLAADLLAAAQAIQMPRRAA